jgi:hypothetical protein
MERLFEGIEPPAPPPKLRSRALAAAREKKSEIPDLWSRIWNHRGLRLVWAAAVVLLLAGHLLVIPQTGAVFSPVDPALVAENRVDEQFLDLLRPIRISENVRPIVGLFAAAADPSEADLKGNPS